jgi:predicted transglutaminase-like cysteine proteinase
MCASNKWPLVAVWICLVSCAAPARVSVAPRLLAGAPVAAPAGALDYCARVQGECDSASDEVLRGTLPATGGAPLRGRLSSPGSGEISGAAASASLFHALLQSRIEPPAEASGAVVTLTRERWRELMQLNRTVNRAIRGGTDREIYGSEERWTRPYMERPEAFAVRGDCEDYALEKRARLIEQGWPAEALAIAVAIVPDIGLHAVLVVQTDRGDLVLDNLHMRPRPVTHRDYAWVSRQVGPWLNRWASARSNSSQTMRTPSPVLAPAQGPAEQAFGQAMRDAIAQAGQSPRDEARESPERSRTKGAIV